MASEKVLEEDELLESFVEIHKKQLASLGLPEIYWATLFNKLKNEVINHI